MVGFNKGSFTKKKKKKESISDNVTEKEERPSKPKKEKKSKFSKKKSRNTKLPKEPTTKRDNVKSEVKREKRPAIKCYNHLCDLTIDTNSESEISVGDPTYVTWFMDCLKSDILPPINATVAQDKYTSDLGKEIRIAMETVSDNLPEDIIVEDSSINISTEKKRGKRKELEVKVL